MEHIAIKIKSKATTKFYQFDQNNSGGSHIVDDKVCHRLFIEAESIDEAISKAEDLGCYWNGCETGDDCPCCGDRWYHPWNHVDLDEMNTKWNGYEISQWLTEKKKGTVMSSVAIENLKSTYPDATWLSGPVVENKYGSTRVVGRIRLDNIEQYAQILANQYGWTKPDCRIFYKDGSVKEIFMDKK